MKESIKDRKLRRLLTVREMGKEQEERTKQVLEKEDSFLSYLRQNTIYNKSIYKDKRSLSERERKVGRPQPKYCELHEAMILDPKTNSPPHADHNHRTGVYRGWICHNCNTKVLPIIDYMKNTGICDEDIKAFLSLAVDYVFTDGKVLYSRLKFLGRK